MGGFTSEQCHWVIQPLLAAGVALDEICDHVVRLAFDGIVSSGDGIGSGLARLVAAEPTHVRGAWVEVVHRMITVDAPAR